MTVRPGPTTSQGIVINYPAPNQHTHTLQHSWEDIRGDLLQEHLGLTLSHQTLNPVRGRAQAPHGIHILGLWASATPITPQAAEGIKATVSIQQAKTQTPHPNAQRGYTIWLAYQDHDTITPKPRAPLHRPEHHCLPPSRDSSSRPRRAPETSSPQYLV